MIHALAQAVRLQLHAGAQEVLLGTQENFRSTSIPPEKRSYKITTMAEADEFERNIKLTPYETGLFAFHMMGGNKIGSNPSNSVIDHNQQVWGTQNLYVMDSSIFPSSVGAYPMETIYTVSRIFAKKMANENLSLNR